MNPALKHFLARLPSTLAESFTPAQLAAIELHFAARYRVDHAINWRRRLLGFYLIVLAGTEHR